MHCILLKLDAKRTELTFVFPKIVNDEKVVLFTSRTNNKIRLKCSHKILVTRMKSKLNISSCWIVGHWCSHRSLDLASVLDLDTLMKIAKHYWIGFKAHLRWSLQRSLRRPTWCNRSQGLTLDQVWYVLRRWSLITGIFKNLTGHRL